MGPANAIAARGADAAQGARHLGAQPAHEVEGAFTDQDEALLRQFAAHVAVAIENARLFRSERQYVDTLETLAEIGREMSSILDLDALLTRIASLTKRLVDYRTFGILLLNEANQELEMKLAVRYGKGAESKHVRLGEGLVGWSALHREAVLVSDVSQDPRYINLVDARDRVGIDAHQGPVHRGIRSRAPSSMPSPKHKGC
jgi:GAF domain-containing protein